MMSSADPTRPSLPPSPGRPSGTLARWRVPLAWIALATALGATAWLYTRPGLMVDLGQLMVLCGFR